MNNSGKLDFHDILVIIAFLVFCCHAVIFGSWIIDDAGITYVYSRNLSSGNGLVSQPGVDPVEGYSNFLWMLMLAPFFWLGIFDPVYLPKILSLIAILISYIVLYKTHIYNKYSTKLVIILALFFCSLNTSIVAWSISGLENAINLLFVILLYYNLCKYNARSNITVSAAMILGLIVSFLALIRPDGVLFFISFPIVLIFRKSSVRKKLILLSYYILPFVMIYGGYLVFKYLYFGDILPNTYYAKVDSTLNIIPSLGKLKDLIVSISGLSGIIILLLTFALFIYIAFVKKIRSVFSINFLLLSIAFLIFLILSRDWMGESRFATSFIMLFYLFIFQLYNVALNYINIKKSIIIAVISILVIGNVILMYSHTFKFKNEFPASFQVVTHLHSKKYDNYASKFNIDNASVLLPDVGATLYYSNIRIYDMSGLIDRTIAHTLYRDIKQFYDYVFEEIKPTLIHTHMYWAYLTQFNKDYRFQRDYVALEHELDQWVLDNYGVEMYSGDYIRKDAVVN